MKKHLNQLALIFVVSFLVISDGTCKEVKKAKEFEKKKEIELLLFFGKKCIEYDNNSRAWFMQIKENDETKFYDGRDGNSYKYIEIGNQVWMTENLRYKPSTNIGKHWAYNNDESNVDTYGYLYDWETAKNSCPNGWHLPSDDEWKQLEMYLGMSQTEADDTGYRGTDEWGKLKETGTTHWKSPNTAATNESGFTTLPGGGRSGNGYFSFIGAGGRWWSSTENSETSAWDRGLDFSFPGVYRGSYNKRLGFSVRCVKD